MSVEDKYKKVSQLEHVLLRPGMYIGSIGMEETPMFVYDDETNKIIRKQIAYIPGLYKICDEVIVNAKDHATMDESVRNIKLSIKDDTIIVFNDGTGIPIKIHSEHQIYIPEMIFGHLLTSSNYDDDVKTVVGGMNGIGAKVCNICSSKFIVETVSDGQYYYQEFSNNMKRKKEPIIKNTKKKDYTQISFVPDFKYFKIENLTQDFVDILKRRMYDIASCTRKNINVYVNDVKIPIKTFQDYVKLHLDPETKYVYQEFKDKYVWEVAVAYMPDSTYQQVSLVNGIYTPLGGTHVDYIVKQITKKLEAEIKKKHKDLSIKANYIKEHLFVFVCCSVENPSFSSQTKDELKTKASAFGSKIEVSDAFIKKLLQTGIDKDIIALAQFKQNTELKKNDGSKKTTIRIPKLEDANHAGGKFSKDCTLILTEGDSAKGLAIAGMSKVGRDKFGAFPLKGKLLNVREATIDKIKNNAEITNLVKILGLKYGQVEQDTRYGKIMIMADSDVDGIHIKGLCINFINHFWKGLFSHDFVTCLRTPIIKVSCKTLSVPFYTQQEYDRWKLTNDSKKWKAKYYKGLGTSNKFEAIEYFSDLKNNRLTYKGTDNTDDLLDLAFKSGKDIKTDVKFEDQRKEWLSTYKKDAELELKATDISVDDFVHKELIHFSIASTIRAIPSIVDGFKPSQRKIMFASFKRNLKEEIKVSQFAGYVSEHTGYHHGEKSLNDTIVKLAQNFVGSNNINLLFPSGMFGTRLEGGSDAASPRYIMTYLEKITRHIFHKDDDAILNYVVEEGHSIEPEYYVPLLPMILVNGATGIGTGWSTKIPQFNPIDIVDNIKRFLSKTKLVKMHPWYKNFTGDINETKKNHYICKGTYSKINNTTIHVTELPIGVWTSRFHDMLLQKEDDKKFVKSHSNNSTDTNVNFKITFLSKDVLDELLKDEEKFEKLFHLSTTFNLQNMTLFDSENKIKQYKNVKEILKEYCGVRLKYYGIRRDYMIDLLKKELNIIKAKVRFILEQIEDTLNIKNKKKDKIYKILEEHKYPDIDGYDYLLGMKFWSITREKVDEMKKEQDVKEAYLEELLGKTPEDLWKDDLDKFMDCYAKFIKI